MKGKDIIYARLLIGFIVLICAEVFSGASVKVGLYNPWTIFVTYWLYFAHFFFFTTLSIKTKKTSLFSLYLWGVLFGLYEGFITKVIWYGYEHNGSYALGSIGPFGLSEFSMVTFFHPIVSFIIPLSVAIMIFPKLRIYLPELEKLTTKRIYKLFLTVLIIGFSSTLGMNSGGLLNLINNIVFMLAVLFVLAKLSRNAYKEDPYDIFVFKRIGYWTLVVYLISLYVLGYFYLIPEGIPNINVLIITLSFYPITLLLLRLNPKVGYKYVESDSNNLKFIKKSFIIILVLAMILSNFSSIVFVLALVNLVLWIVLGYFFLFIVIINSFRNKNF